jgi:sulfur carrier protein ThiS
VSPLQGEAVEFLLPVTMMIMEDRLAPLQVAAMMVAADLVAMVEVAPEVAVAVNSQLLPEIRTCRRMFW